MHRLRCPHCASSVLRTSPVVEMASESMALTPGVLRCTGCGEQFDAIGGVPCLGKYAQEDMQTLMEIAANSDNTCKGFRPEFIESLESLFPQFDAAEDKEGFVQAHPLAQAPYFPNRYQEWKDLARLTQGIALDGRSVLDVGAGMGYDSFRLHLLGAQVTALEINPLHASYGRALLPGAQWYCGFSHALPFADASFDAVYCNAALHHMRDIPAALTEALRVLRPGGHLLTSGDSFRSNASNFNYELHIFDRNPDVLLGINECIPRLEEFTSTLSRFQDHLKIELFTTMLYNAPRPDGTLEDITDFTAWDFHKDLEFLGGRPGALALRVTLKSPIPAAPNLQHAGVLKPLQLVEWLSNQPEAVANLATLIPEALVNAPFPGGDGSKFEQCNGWRLPLPNTAHRTAYKRGRWFLRRQGKSRLTFELRSPVPARFSILLNAQSAMEIQVEPSTWTRVSLDLRHLPPAQPFAVEIRMENTEEAFDNCCFDVRNRRLKAPPFWDWALRRASSG